MLVLAALIEAPWGARRAVPAELVGVWTTDDAGYAGRALEIQPHAVVFHADTGRAAFPVWRVRRRVHGAGVRYQVHYLVEGSRATLSLLYAPRHELIRLDARPELLWRRSRP